MIVVLACIAISALAVAAYLLSGLDDRYLDTRDADSLDRYPRARAAWARLHEGER